jgi:hypothetical protein
LERSYSFAIEDLEDEGPKPAGRSAWVLGELLWLPGGVVHGASLSRRR